MKTLKMQRGVLILVKMVEECMKFHENLKMLKIVMHAEIMVKMQ